MTDPMEALNGLQAALDNGAVRLQSCELNPTLGVMLDKPRGMKRFTYAQVNGGKVQAIAILAETPPIQGALCFQVGYAVTKSMRRQGIGSTILRQALDEMKHGLSRTQIKEFYVEAVVATDNEASNKIANRLISESPKPNKDSFSGDPIYQYLLKVQVGT